MEKSKDVLKVLTYTLIAGIISLTFGIYLVGKHIQHGNLVLIFGSFLIYISLILVAIKIH